MTRCFKTLVLGVVGTLCLGMTLVLGDPDASWWDRHVESISCVRPGYFVNPADCHSFYRCVDRSTWNKPALQRYDFTCPTGMVFDPAFSVCTKPGSNGCADKWWPGSGENSDGGRSGGSPGSGDNSLERPPALFNGNRRPGGNGRPSGSGASPFGGGGGDPLDADFGSPSKESTTKPSGNTGLFNGEIDLFGGNGGGDPLDADFGSSPEPGPGGNSNTAPPFRNGNRDPESRPGSGSRTPFDSSGGTGGDPLDADFGSSPSNSGPGGNSNSNDIPTFLRDRKPESKPDSGSRGPFGGSSSSGDPLDADFESSPDSSGSEPGGNSNDIPPFLRDRTVPENKPASGSRGGPFVDRNGSDDPLDNDFGASPSNSGSRPGGNSNDIPPFLNDNRAPGNRPGSGPPDPFGDPLDNGFGSPSRNSGSREDSRSSSKEGRDNNRNGGSRPSSSSNESGGGASWWGTNTNPPPKWDRNDVSPNSVEFDNWNISPQSSNRSPDGANWGGSPKPSSPINSGDSSPWRPTGPWGSGSFNDIGSGSSPIPQSPPPPPSFPNSPGRPSWWDPPYALPYQPRRPNPVPENPRGPDPWNFPYRPRYPQYQIVAYPTWPPGPYSNRNPIIVVYSNSRK